MNDLPRIERRIALLRAQIAPLERLKKELERLETAAEVLRHLDEDDLASIAPDSAESIRTLDLEGATIVDAADSVLREISNRTAHYAKIAHLARLRGFESRTGADDRAVDDSFRRLMIEHEDFVHVGKGYFRLRSARDRRIDNDGDLTGLTMQECAIKILAEQSEPMRAIDIANTAMARGYSSPNRDSTPEQIRDSFRGVLSRKGEFVSVGKGRYRLAREDEGPVISNAT